ncbi:MAG TPA: phosphoribosylamine--glycine ligase, partial [Planctomycetia bacterium]|nr:phosphoribosylamine--glycine ligase [Planctomycetia bacterium]
MLTIGRGGREHALAWRLAKSPSVEKSFVAPGNPGTAADAINVPIPEDDVAEILRFCKREKIDLAVIGPEAPLVAGLADALRAAGVAVFGPSKDAAELEGSKIFCKRFLRKANIPTAEFHVFTEMEQVENYLDNRPGPCVVKADGLAAGKGAIVCDTERHAHAAAVRMLVDKEFGKAGEQILIEERLEGPEVSILALTDGKSILTLEACQDFKRALDGDKGPNTGGMGAICPNPRVDAALVAKIEKEALLPTV